MKAVALSTLLVVAACSTTPPVQAPLGGTYEVRVVEKQVCGTYQCGMIGSLDCGNCEDLKGYVCGDNGRLNTCGKQCAEMLLDARCDGINGGYYNHQFPLRCHQDFSKLNCITMSDYVYPDDSVRCCHLPEVE